MIGLTNASIASQDWYQVRMNHASLATVSAQHSTPQSGQNSTSTGGSPAQSSTNTGNAVAVNTAVIAGSVVGGLIAVAVLAVLAWWFYFRRRFGRDGVVFYREKNERNRERPETIASSRKHVDVARQKSMVEGYSDFEGESWMSATTDSIRLRYLPEAVEDDSRRRNGSFGGGGESSRESSPSKRSTAHDEAPKLVDIDDEPSTSDQFEDAPISPPADRAQRRDVSPIATRAISFASPDQHRTGTGGSYHSGKSDPTRASLSMSGPFPSPARGSLQRPDTSPMYDIRSSDYFAVPGGSPTTPISLGSESRGRKAASGQGTQRRESSWSGGRFGVGQTVSEEPIEMEDRGGVERN